MSKKINKVVALFLTISFVFQQVGFAQIAGVELNLAGALVRMQGNVVTDKFRPAHMRFFSYDSLHNNFKLILDKGDLKNLKGTELDNVSKELMNYFLVGVTLNNDAFWVNLRPDSENEIIDNLLAKTDVGKIMLEADLELKKDTASFTSPQTTEGKAYWNKLYKKAEELFGSDQITIPTLTRPWIVPDEVIVRENKDSAYVYKASLKVMLEQDHLKNSVKYSFKDPRQKELNEYSSQLIRELIIPKLNREVNTSKKYSQLRQVLFSLILSRWFKSRFQGKAGDYAALINKANLANLTSKTAWSATTYFKAYQESFNKGEYNIKEPVYTPTGQVIRSYFSGGADLTGKSLPAFGNTAASPLGFGALPGIGDITSALKNNRDMVSVGGADKSAASPISAEYAAQMLKNILSRLEDELDTNLLNQARNLLENEPLKTALHQKDQVYQNQGFINQVINIFLGIKIKGERTIPELQSVLTIGSLISSNFLQQLSGKFLERIYDQVRGSFVEENIRSMAILFDSELGRSFLNPNSFKKLIEIFLSNVVSEIDNMMPPPSYKNDERLILIERYGSKVLKDFIIPNCRFIIGGQDTGIFDTVLSNLDDIGPGIDIKNEFDKMNKEQFIKFYNHLFSALLFSKKRTVDGDNKIIEQIKDISSVYFSGSSPLQSAGSPVEDNEALKLLSGYVRDFKDAFNRCMREISQSVIGITSSSGSVGLVMSGSIIDGSLGTMRTSIDELDKFELENVPKDRISTYLTTLGALKKEVESAAKNDSVRRNDYHRVQALVSEFIDKLTGIQKVPSGPQAGSSSPVGEGASFKATDMSNAFLRFKGTLNLMPEVNKQRGMRPGNLALAVSTEALEETLNILKDILEGVDVLIEKAEINRALDLLRNYKEQLKGDLDPTGPMYKYLWLIRDADDAIGKAIKKLEGKSAASRGGASSALLNDGSAKEREKIWQPDEIDAAIAQAEKTNVTGPNTNDDYRAVVRLADISGMSEGQFRKVERLLLTLVTTEASGKLLGVMAEKTLAAVRANHSRFSHAQSVKQNQPVVTGFLRETQSPKEIETIIRLFSGLLEELQYSKGNEPERRLAIDMLGNLGGMNKEQFFRVVETIHKYLFYSSFRYFEIAAENLRGLFVWYYPIRDPENKKLFDKFEENLDRIRKLEENGAAESSRKIAFIISLLKDFELYKKNGRFLMLEELAPITTPVIYKNLAKDAVTYYVRDLVNSNKNKPLGGVGEINIALLQAQIDKAVERLATFVHGEFINGQIPVYSDDRQQIQAFMQAAGRILENKNYWWVKASINQAAYHMRLIEEAQQKEVMSSSSVNSDLDNVKRAIGNGDESWLGELSGSLDPEAARMAQNALSDMRNRQNQNPRGDGRYYSGRRDTPYFNNVNRIEEYWKVRDDWGKSRGSSAITTAASPAGSLDSSGILDVAAMADSGFNYKEEYSCFLAISHRLDLLARQFQKYL
ncbi:MAG: hypothetical protein HY761_04290 [Candidatus Omnitrophica bacterium]|nr:hypothetical protein [Candidatus Omnitrophota bacterium]